VSLTLDVWLSVVSCHQTQTSTHSTSLSDRQTDRQTRDIRDIMSVTND